MTIDLRLGDCLELMKALPDGSVDAVITDPPTEAGFELDLFIETHVVRIPDGWCEDWTKGIRQEIVRLNTPEYSTSIAAAWLLMERLGEWHMVSIQNETGGGFTCIVRPKGQEKKRVIEYADTAPLAICRAALRVAQP